MAERDPEATAHPTYRFDFDPDTSYGSAVRLLEASGPPGLVLDLGCGYGAIADPLVHAGWTYAGMDLDEAAVADLRERGLEAATIDLDAPSAAIADQLRTIIADRPLRAVAALDVLEHLRDPATCLEAITSVAHDHPDLDLVVSLPNVTHVDVAAKLLAGRWDTMTTGLLDRTHLHFFDMRGATSILAQAGWEELAADDVLTPVTEQADPPDLPTVRPGSPLNDLLRAVRARAGHGGATTFQFVRRLRLDTGDRLSGSSRPPVEAPTGLVVVALPGREQLATLTSELAAQHHRDFEVILCEPPAGSAPDAVASAMGIAAEAINVVDDVAVLDAAVAHRAGRYVCALGPNDALTPEALAAFVAGAERAPGRVLAGTCSDDTGTPLPLARFDLVQWGAEGSVVLGAYALPRLAVEAGVVSLQGSPAQRAASIARAVMWCGRHDLEEVICRSGDPGSLRSLASEVCSVLDEEPLLLAPGAAGPLVDLHQRLTSAERSRHEAGEEAHRIGAELAEHRAYHAAYARAVEEQLEELRAQPWRTAARVAARRARHAGSAVKRRVRRARS